MSIIERRREIGILKSLGADERDIRLLFLAESGLIGSIGAVFGIIFGWVITRAASLVIKVIMEKQDIPEMDLLASPPDFIPPRAPPGSIRSKPSAPNRFQSF